MKPKFLQVALDTPLPTLFDYRAPDGEAVGIGQLVRVPFGRQQMVGVVLAHARSSEVPDEKLKDVLEVLTCVPALDAHWRELCRFAADYYHRSLGEVMLPVLPKLLRTSQVSVLQKRLAKLGRLAASSAVNPIGEASLNTGQAAACDAIGAATGFAPFLLFGVTGSGKTEVYLQVTARILQREPTAQVLLLVPEINLTPQFLQHLQARFPDVLIALQHSGMAEGERVQHWLMAHTGVARIVLGTRMAVMASMPHLQLIVVDEEHDPSYKQQEGLRYSARDLAVWRARQLRIPVVLGSATPSLESWLHAQNGRYRRLDLRERAVAKAALPTIRLLDLARHTQNQGLTQALIDAIKQRQEHGEQSLLFLNRRGYAPVMQCEACGWISHCRRCTAYLVIHKSDKRLRCHHCGLEQAIPSHCPDCGNIDLHAMGRGTQRLEENLETIFPTARITRIDADSTRKKGSAERAFSAVHEGEVDLLVGTQMVAKGHDFKKLTLVGVLNADNALFSSDFRASERLFSQLMQVAGRAGRQGGAQPAEVLIQTRYPDHPLYQALARHDYERFAHILLHERKQAHMPPFSFQAILRAEARELSQALAFLQEAKALLEVSAVVVHEPVPMRMVRVANVERAQLLLESTSRPALQTFLKTWLPRFRKTRVWWQLEIDPVDI